MPGARTPAHTHPGPEVLYIVDGEQCMETPKAGLHLRAGRSYVLAGDVIHRGMMIGSKARRALALNLYDAAHPVSHDLGDAPLVSCKQEKPSPEQDKIKQVVWDVLAELEKRGVV